MTNRRQSLAVKTITDSAASYTPTPSKRSHGKGDEPWMAILFEELERALRGFARESGRLTRLVQRKKGCRMPSEGFSLLVAERLEAVEYAFQTYVRRKEELLTYIRATSWQVDRAKSGKTELFGLKPPSN